MNTQNDHKGRVIHLNPYLMTFFASGSKGHEVRGDGYGGHMVRGYYGITKKLPRSIGPFSCRTRATNEALAVHIAVIANGEKA